jgi:hypothetical protein
VPPTTIQWITFAAFLIPLVEALLALWGNGYSLLTYRRAPEKFSLLIMQITSVGKEPEMVQKSIDKLHEYKLTMPYQIWVCIEPDMFTDYQNVDRVIVVPKDFECKPVDKARALEYTRRLRVELGLNRADVKMLMMDDDSLCSKRYVNLAWEGDYDICQGITVPNRWYAMGTWQHVLMSHLDNARARNCLIYCSTGQGPMQHPIFVHGEGLCFTGRCEDIVTWDFPIVGSDDLVFGTQAADMNMRWGYFPAAIQIVSPWTWKEHINQRWRWTWGNFDAIFNGDVMGRFHAFTKMLKYLSGIFATLASLFAVFLVLSGRVVLPHWATILFTVSLAVWFSSYGVSAWLATGGEPNREIRPNPIHYWSFRILQTLLAVILTPVSALTPFFVISYSVLRGRPKRFIMIRKHNAAMKL